MSAYSVFKAILKYPFRLLYRIKIEGKENEPEGAYIICANHSSFVDPILITSSLRQNQRWLAKRELTKNPFMKLVFRITNAIPINRQGLDTPALHECIDSVKAGTSIGIFPQGTRMRRVEPQPEQALPGLSLIACISKATILPISIVTKRRQPGIFRKTRIVIGKPISYEEYSSKVDRSDKKALASYLFGKVCEVFKENG